MQEVVSNLNEQQRLAENREKLLEIQNRFSDKVRHSLALFSVFSFDSIEWSGFFHHTEKRELFDTQPWVPG